MCCDERSQCLMVYLSDLVAKPILLAKESYDPPTFAFLSVSVSISVSMSNCVSNLHLHLYLFAYVYLDVRRGHLLQVLGTTYGKDGAFCDVSLSCADGPTFDAHAAWNLQHKLCLQLPTPSSVRPVSESGFHGKNPQM